MTVELVKDEKPVTSYAFTLSFKVGGVVDSTITKEQTLERLHNELTLFYGDEGYEILEFRIATPEEIETYKKYLDGEYDDDNETVN